MPSIDEDALKKQLAANELLPVYFLHGQESALTSQYTHRIAKKAVGSAAGDFNLQVFDGKAPVSAIYDAAEALPVFAPRKCVIVRELNPEELGADAVDRLLALVADVPETTVLIFAVTGFTLKKTGKTRKLLTAIEKAGAVCEFGQDTPAKLAKLLAARIERAGSQIKMSDATDLANATLCSRSLAFREADKLITYANGAPITRDMIDLLVSRQVDTSTFALARAVIAGNYKQAMTILDELFYQRIEPIAIVSALSMTFLDLHRASAAMNAGLSEQQVADDFGYPKNRRFAVTNAFRDARKLSAKRLRTCIGFLAETDIALKSTRLDPRVRIERMVVQMMLSGEGA